MKLYLMRHGHAQEIGGAIGNDRERPLSERGRDDVASAGNLLSRVEPRLQHILTSPLNRAVETGMILSSRIPSSPYVAQNENLNPGFRQRALLDDVLGLRASCVLVVGHQPDMSMFISYLISDSRAAVEMEAGALAAIELDPISPRSGRLRWLLPPGLCHLNFQA